MVTMGTRKLLFIIIIMYVCMYVFYLLRDIVCPAYNGRLTTAVDAGRYRAQRQDRACEGLDTTI